MSSAIQDLRVDLWRRAVFERDLNLLGQLLDTQIAFRSPITWQPNVGKEYALLILSTVITVFEDFHYHRQWIDGNDWALEFSARIGDRHLKGIDLIRWNDAGQIVEFEVLIRPANALQALGQAMAERLAGTEND